MSKNCKIWLWIIFVLNVIGLILNVCSTFLATLAFPFVVAFAGFTLALYIIASILLVVGIAVMLFAENKSGFYLMVIASVITFICNVSTGQGIIASLISAAVVPAITYYFLNH